MTDIDDVRQRSLRLACDSPIQAARPNGTRAKGKHFDEGIERVEDVRTNAFSKAIGGVLWDRKGTAQMY